MIELSGCKCQQCALLVKPVVLCEARCLALLQLIIHTYKLTCNEHTDMGSTDSLSTGQTVGISVVVTFFVSFLFGIAVGVGVAYLFMRHKTHKSVDITREGPPQQQQPTPGLLYEEIAPAKEEIELKTNEAYGPVGQ